MAPTAVWIFVSLLLVITIYLAHVNRLMKSVPREVEELRGPRWTVDQLKQTYRELEKNPPTYDDKLLPKQNRRYVVTGGNGKYSTSTTTTYLILYLFNRSIANSLQVLLAAT